MQINIPDSVYVQRQNGGITGWSSLPQLGDQSFDSDPTASSDAAFQGWLDLQALPQTYALKIANGISITSSGTPDLNATYALDALTLTQIQGLATNCASGIGFPGGVSTFAFPDINGTPRTFTATSIVNLYKAMISLVFQMQTTLATLQAAQDASWPPQTATIA